MRKLAAAEARLISDGEAALSEAELRQYNRFIGAQIREWENSFYQYEPGLFTEDELEGRRERWRIQMAGGAELGGLVEYSRERWAAIRDSCAPSFRAEIDRIVVEVGG